MEHNQKSKIVVVLGASSKEDRYANIAMASLLKHDHKVIAVGREAGTKAHGIIIQDSLKDLIGKEPIDTVTIYLSEKNQQEYEHIILSLKPKRVIFNPGAENGSFYTELKNQGIEAINACTLVMLSVGTF